MRQLPCRILRPKMQYDPRTPAKRAGNSTDTAQNKVQKVRSGAYVDSFRPWRGPRDRLCAEVASDESKKKEYALGRGLRKPPFRHGARGVYQGAARMRMKGTLISLLERHFMPQQDSPSPFTCDPQNFNTPLHQASGHGHRDVAAILLDRGANVEAMNKVSIPAGMWVQLPVRLHVRYSDGAVLSLPASTV